jgi:hypothetical protein
MRRSRFPLLVVIAGLAVFCIVVPPPARAGAATTQGTANAQVSTTTSAVPQILPGLDIRGATVTSPGRRTRQLDASQATAFVQAWLPDSVYGTPPHKSPPPGLPVWTVLAQTKFRGVDVPMTMLFVTQGSTAWLSMPAPQDLGWSVVSRQRWIEPPARTIAAFEGKLKPIATAATTTTTAAHPSSSHGSNSDSSATTVIIVMVLGVAFIGGGIAWATSRRRKASVVEGRATR